MRDIPSEADWRSEPWDVDVPYAYDHFAHKSNEEAQHLFIGNALYYQEDLVFMPVACLKFYIHAYIDYLLSDASEDDSDGASCFFGLVESRCQDIIGFDGTTRSKVKAVIERLAKSQDWFGADEDIYGDFRGRAERSLNLLQ